MTVTRAAASTDARRSSKAAKAPARRTKKSATGEAPRGRGKAAARAAPQPVNEVRLVGRISRAPEERVLPSGDLLVTFRVVVARPGGSRVGLVDALDCAAWSPRAQRSVATWAVDDVVEVSGAVRRRFFRTPAGAASRVEVEVGRARIIRRAASG